MRRFLSLFFWAFMTVSSAVLFPIAVVIWALTAPFDRRKVALHAFTCFWASLYTWLNPAWRVTIRGREKIDPQRAVVLVANHLSLVDILVMFRLFTHFKWVSKAENFRVPFIGWNMSMNRYIRLVRGQKQSVVRMMQECEDALAGGNSIMMFPEGTRSTTNAMRKFKPGAFEIALKAHAPVQPLVIRGSGDALPKRGFILQGRHEISVTVLDRIDPEDFGAATAEALSAHVREIIAAEQVRANAQRPGSESVERFI